MNPEETDDRISRQVNKETLAEMENVIPMLTIERTALRRWINKGNDPEEQGASCSSVFFCTDPKRQYRPQPEQG